MGLLDSVRKFLQSSGQLDVRARFELMREAVFATMSRFYMVRDRENGEIYGLKVLDLEKTEAFESRFVGLSKPAEGKIATSFDHPHIVKTHEHGMTTKGEQYLLMEYLHGSGLNALIRSRDPCLEGNRVSLISQMADALGTVHNAGYIHRDVCPRNFICLPGGKALKLIDFGLTVPAEKEYMQPGNRTGTPNYMAPEIIRRRPTDHRLDIFSFGVTCYQLCALELPWPTTDTTGKAAMLHDSRQPVNILELRPRLNKQLAELIHRCMAKDPADRPESLEAFQRQLSSVPSEDE